MIIWRWLKLVSFFTFYFRSVKNPVQKLFIILFKWFCERVEKTFLLEFMWSMLYQEIHKYGVAGCFFFGYVILEVLKGASVPSAKLSYHIFDHNIHISWNYHTTSFGNEEDKERKKWELQLDSFGRFNFRFAFGLEPFVSVDWGVERCILMLACTPQTSLTCTRVRVEQQ